MKAKNAPKAHAMGMPHHIPAEPKIVDKYHESGILTIQSENKVINMGIIVSPAPRKTPL